MLIFYKLCSRCVTLMGLFFLHTTALGRSVYLNGSDVSSLRNQQLKKVDVLIDDVGNVRIQAPHYNVKDQSTFKPIGKFPQPRGQQEFGKVTHPASLPRHPQAPLKNQETSVGEPSREAHLQGQEPALPSSHDVPRPFHVSEDE